MKIARACKQDASLASVKAWLSSKEHWLLIIDNADDPTVDVSRLIPSGNKGAVLITTRNPDFQKFASAGSYRVNEMSPEDATALLLKTTALQNVEEKEKDEARKVVETLGYLALAIIQAGAVIRQRLIGLDGFCELYSKRKKELLESGRSDSSIDYQRSVYTTWEISVKMIEDIQEQHAGLALELLRLFSFMHHDGILEGMFQAARSSVYSSTENSNFARSLLVQLMPSEWDQLLMGKALGLLVAFSLITVDETRRISMHPLVHEWSRARMPIEDRTKAWRTSVLTLSRATEFKDEVAAWQQRRLLLPHIDAILSHGEQDLFSDGSDLEDRIFASWKFGMAYRENCRLNTKDLPLRALMCIEGKFPVHYEHRHYAMGEVAFDLEASGNYKEATDLRQRLLKEERGKDNIRVYSITKAAANLAEDYTHSGLHQKAIELCEATIDEFENALPEGSSILLHLWEILGEATYALKNPKRARKFLEKALECYNKREYPERNFFGIEVLRRLSVTYAVLGLRKKAKATQNEYVAQLKDAYGAEDLRTVIAIARCKDLETPGGFSVRKYVQSRAQGIGPTKEALENHRSMQGALHVATLSCMTQLAWDYYQCGAFAKATALQEELVNLLIQKWGEDHYSTIVAVENLTQMRRRAAIRKAFYWWLPKRVLEKDWVQK
jgi:tetratricopeptide (TPR) repeat protein